MISSHLLLHFAAVAEHLSFRAAADAMRVDQATLSRRIRQLEEQLGFRLFERTTRSVALTPEGEALLPAAADLARAQGRAALAVDALVSQNASVLRLGTHPYVYWSPQLRAVIGQFASDAPAASTRSTSGTSRRHVERLLNGSLDVALITDAAPFGEIETMPLMEVRPNLLLPIGHEMAGRSSIRLNEVRDLSIAIVQPVRERGDFDHIYGPFFAHGARAVTVSEGTPALVHYAAADGLAMISLRPQDMPPPPGFVRRTVSDAPRVAFLLARKTTEGRGLARRFWQSALRAMREPLAS
jgi:DNA-binding transcriptional LysR family regulator